MLPLTFLPSVLTSSFLFSPVLAGETDGDATGEAVATGVGVATGLFGTSLFGSQAPRMVTLAASNVDNRIDLLIVLLLLLLGKRGPYLRAGY